MPRNPLSHTIRQNLDAVHTEIAQACQQAGRCAADVRLVAVTKYAEWEWVTALAEYHTVFGENRPQQLTERAAILPEAEWHLIGQLQRNKVRAAISHASVIHSVDSLKLVQRTAMVAADMGKRPQILLQVNVSGESTKSGFAPADLVQAWPDVADAHRSLEIVGLMTMAPASQAASDARATFRGLAELRQQLAAHPSTAREGIHLKELSMGMSGDYQIAIEEGATIVRIGSRLYEGL